MSKLFYASSISTNKLIDEAIGYIEETFMTNESNFYRSDADYLRSVLRVCKFQIEHLETMIKDYKHD